mmetsp:Transcript_32691/g.77041  ORF Transcript_32691/g.77041 Transcript_32691/m.77041 type:complete len:246 (+) Transcript_32691:40-777(+)
MDFAISFFLLCRNHSMQQRIAPPAFQQKSWQEFSSFRHCVFRRRGAEDSRDSSKRNHSFTRRIQSHVPKYIRPSIRSSIHPSVHPSDQDGAGDDSSFQSMAAKKDPTRYKDPVTNTCVVGDESSPPDSGVADSRSSKTSRAVRLQTMALEEEDSEWDADAAAVADSAADSDSAADAHSSSSVRCLHTPARVSCHVRTVAAALASPLASPSSSSSSGRIRIPLSSRSSSAEALAKGEGRDESARAK